MKPISSSVRDRCVILGRRIRAERRARDMAQHEVGSRMNPPKNKRKIHEIEWGRIDVTLGELRQIAAILGTTPEELLRDVRLSSPGNPTVAGLLEFCFELGKSPACVVKEFKQGDPHAAV